MTTTGLPVAVRALRSSSCDGGEGDGGAVAAGEAFEFDGHLFAFEGWGETGEEEDGVGGAGDFDGFVAEDCGRRLPGEIDAGGSGAVEVFEADGVGFGVVEVDGRGDLGAALAGFAGGVGEELVVDEEAEGFEVLAGVAGVDAGTEAVVAGGGRGEGAGPADGVVVAGEAGDGDDFIPVEVDGLRSMRVRTGVPERSLEAKYSPVRPLRLAGFLKGGGRYGRRLNSKAFGEGGALRVGDGGLGEALFDAGDGVDGLGWGSVVVALEGLDELGGGSR